MQELRKLVAEAKELGINRRSYEDEVMMLMKENETIYKAYLFGRIVSLKRVLDIVG
jgi:hypothetical protein